MFPNEYNFNMPFSAGFNNFGAPMMGTGLRGGLGAINRSGGLFSRLVGGVRGINWAGLLNNTSRTLGVINQAIPVVKQIGPMYNNMKSMLKIASLFKDETEPTPPKSNNKQNTNNNINKTNNKKEEKENTIIKNNYSNSPNFFI